MPYSTTNKRFTAQDKIMLRDGYARVSVVAAALGAQGSTVYRRIQRAAYKGVMSGKFWYVRLDDVYSAGDTSESQRTELSRVINDLQGTGSEPASGAT